MIDPSSNRGGSWAFPRDFTWGVATASYQIEGNRRADGAGRCNWDTFCQRPDAVYEGHTGESACNHYQLYQDDLRLLSDLGVTSYRFSVCWPRVLPEGTGPLNPAGLGFYDRLVDGLLERGITPYVTLFHWDYPQALEDRGGWLNSRSPHWFAEYVTHVAKHLGDRVKHWFTLNEPHAPIDGGLREGRHAPGLTLPMSEVLRAAHHTLLAHGLGTQVLRAEVKGSWVAMAPVLLCATPHRDTLEDIEAARAFTFSMSGKTLRTTTWWMDPVFGKGYPEDGLRQFGSSMPQVSAAELDLIAQPLDAVGFNLYDSPVVQADAEGRPQVIPPPVGAPRTAFNWPITPQGHFYGPKFAYERYGKPVLITENGLSCRDYVHRDGSVPDAARIDFIQGHLEELSRAHQSGVPVLGYFHWSLLDNFEWNHGYRERFGLVHVDYQTLKRTKKASFFAYRDIIREHRSE
jgi:beta-glucosidase